MERTSVIRMDRKDEDIAYGLIDLGVDRPTARVLAVLQGMKKAKTQEIEMAGGLRQPEVSVATKLLREKGWIKETLLSKPGKGRPNKVFELKVDFGTILATLEEDAKKRNEGTLESIKRLREIAKKTVAK